MQFFQLPKRFFRHFIAWLLCYAINLYLYSSSLATYTKGEWLLTGYNLIVLTIVFYVVTAIMHRYFCRVNWHKYRSLAFAAKIRYLLKVEVLMAVAVVAVYVTVSILMDRNFSRWPYDTVKEHIDQKLIRVAAYFAGAVMYSYYKKKDKMHELVIKSINSRVEKLQQKTNNFKELEELIKQENSLN